VAVDGTGDVFFADSKNKAVKEWHAATGTVSTLVAGLNYPDGVAVDGAGDVFFADRDNDALRELPRAFVPGGAVTEGPAAGADALLAPVLPATQSLSGPFAPRSDQGWLTISGGANGVVRFAFTANPGGAPRTAHLTVLGQQVTVTQAGSSYVPANPVTLVSSGLLLPHGVAVDGAGDVFIADTFNNAVKEWHGATQTVSTLVSGLSPPTGVAVDGAGDVFIADRDNHAVKEWHAATGTVSTLVSSDLLLPQSVAVDAAGDVFIADHGSRAVLEWHAATGTLSTLFSWSSRPYGVAVDGAGNVFFADTGNNAVLEWHAATGTVSTLVSGLSRPQGVAVDGAGDVFIADTGNNAIREWHAATGTVSTLASGLYLPQGVAVDGAGNVFIADTNNNAIKELPRAFVPGGALSEGAAAGADALLPVLPTTQPLTGAYAPRSDQSWLTIDSVANGVVHFSFTANPGDAPRTAHLTVLGQQIAVTQAAVAVATHFQVTPSADSVVAGTPVSLTVTAEDDAGNPAPYLGTVHFSSTDPLADLPPDYTFTAADNGVHTFTDVILRTAGNGSVTATDTTNTITGTATVSVAAAAADHYAVATSAQDPDVAGTAFDVTVTALDAYGNVATGYVGTVHFSSADPYGASLPADYTFQAGDQGQHTFAGGATLFTAGTWDVTATDTATSISGTANVRVIAAAASQLGVTTGAASPDVAGTAFDVTVTAQDPYGNTATGYTGTVHFSSADPYGASLPADYTFQATDQGVATFAGVTTLYTAGTWDVTATDTSSGISGAAFVTVQAAPAVAFQLVVTASPTSGVPFDVTLIAVDAYGNTDTYYAGTVTFSTSDSDPGVVLPPAYTFQPGDQGQVTFPGGVTLLTLGAQSLTATDTLSGICGTVTVTVQ
jgi:sugar lactone lactonase YvrE